MPGVGPSPPAVRPGLAPSRRLLAGHNFTLLISSTDGYVRRQLEARSSGSVRWLEWQGAPERTQMGNEGWSPDEKRDPNKAWPR